MVGLRLLPVVVVSKRACVWEFPWLLSLASVLKIRLNPSSSTEKPWTGSVHSGVASTFLQDRPVQLGARLDISLAGGTWSWSKSDAAVQGCEYIHGCKLKGQKESVLCSVLLRAVQLNFSPSCLLQGFLFMDKHMKQQVCSSEWPGSCSFQRYEYPDSIRELSQVCVIWTLWVASFHVLTMESPEPLSLFHF